MAIRSWRRRALLASLLTLAAPFALGPPANAAPVITNGGFESPPVPFIQTFTAPTTISPGWTVDAGSVDIEANDGSPAGMKPYAGLQGLDMSGNDAGSLYQDISTTAGARYSLSFHYAGTPVISSDWGCGASSADRIKKMDVAWGGAVVAHVVDDTTGITTMAWHEQKVLVDSAGTTSRLRFTSLSPGRCGMGLDEVALTAPTMNQSATQLTASAGPSVWGEGVTFTATVLGASAGVAPTGSVRFDVDGSAVATVGLDATGHAAFSSSSLAVGDHVVSAHYLPSAGLDPSLAEIAHRVGKAHTQTTFTFSPSHPVTGQATTFAAHVAVDSPGAGLPAGEVQFRMKSGQPIGPPVAVDGSGTATMLAAAGAGAYDVEAAYSGDANFEPSVGSAHTVVGKAATSTTLASVKNPAIVGDDLVFTVDVSALLPGEGVPTGDVAFSIDGDPIGSLPLEDDGTLVVGLGYEGPPVEFTLQATYVGDPYYAGSADSLRQAVTGPPIATTPVVTTPQPSPAIQVLPSRTTAASNAFTIGKRVRYLHDGGALLKVTLPGPGVLKLSDAAPRGGRAAKVRPAALIRSVTRRVTKAGTVQVKVALTKAGRAQLRGHPKLRLKVRVSFKPTGGSVRTKVLRLTLRAN